MGLMRGLSVLAAALAVGGFAAAAARSTPAPKPPKPKYVPGEVIVRFKADVAPARRAQALDAEGARRKRALRLPGAEVVSVVDGESVEATVRELEARPDVLFAEPNYVYRATATRRRSDRRRATPRRSPQPRMSRTDPPKPLRGV